MSWYYAQGSERIGPVSDTEFESLVNGGTIRPDTLVWQEGWGDWKPYSQVQESTPTAGGSASNHIPGHRQTKHRSGEL